MAPIKKRTTIRSKIAAKNRPISIPNASDLDASTGNDATLGDNNESFSSFANSKRDKRVMKHSAFMSKIEKSQKKPLKRGGRRNKQLQTKLEGLVDALPELENEAGESDWEGVSDDDEAMDGTVRVTASGTGSKEDEMLGALAGMVNVRPSIKKTTTTNEGAAGGKMKMKSLKSRPGAAKRKAKLEGREMERFAKNMAQMVQPGGSADAGAASTSSAVGAQSGSAGATSNRWAALRGFIGQTMEKNPSFGKPAA